MKRILVVPLLIMVVSLNTVRAQVSTNNLVLWLRADTLSLSHGAAVTSWTDSSPSLNHFTQGNTSFQPTYATNGVGGKATVRFDGLNDYLSSTANLDLTTGLTIFIVAKNDLRKDLNGLFRIDESVLDGSDSDLEIFWQAGTTDAASGHIQYVVNRGSSPVGQWQGLNAGPPVGRAYIYDLLASASAVTQRVNGVNYSSLQAPGTLPSAVNQAFLGLGAAQSTIFLDGDISEVLIYNSTLSLAQRDSIYSYLEAQYFIPEPNVLLLLVSGGVVLCHARRKKA